MILKTFIERDVCMQIIFYVNFQNEIGHHQFRERKI